MRGSPSASSAASTALRILTSASNVCKKRVCCPRLDAGALLGRGRELAHLALYLFERLLLLPDGVERERAVLAYGAESFERQLGLGLAGVAAGDGLDHL